MLKKQNVIGGLITNTKFTYYFISELTINTKSTDLLFS